MQVSDLGVQNVEGRFADAHLGSRDAGDIKANVYEVSFRDEQVKHSDFVVLLSLEEIVAEVTRHPTAPEIAAHVYADDDVVVVQHRDARWHLSVTGRARPPAFHECAAIARRVRPGVVFAAVSPAAERPGRVDPKAVHLWELDDDNLEELWR